MRKTHSLRRRILAVAAVAIGFGPAAFPASAGEALTLRVNDAEALPGGEVAVLVRTYAPAPVGQGQLCLQSCRRPVAGARPACFTSFGGYQVFSASGDAQSWMVPQFSGPTQLLMLNVHSPSATINSVDGPLAVFLYRIPDTAVPGESFLVEIDPGNSFLFDAKGQSIPIDARAGLVTVRSPSAAPKFLVEGDRVAPGEVARLGVESIEILPLASGRIAVRYPQAVAAAPPTVAFDARLGRVSFTVDNSVPGLTLIDFQSLDGSLNRIPGRLVSLNLPTRPTAVPGSKYRVRIDASLSYFEAAGGGPQAYELIHDLLEFE